MTGVGDDKEWGLCSLMARLGFGGRYGGLRKGLQKVKGGGDEEDEQDRVREKWKKDREFRSFRRS